MQLFGAMLRLFQGSSCVKIYVWLAIMGSNTLLHPDGLVSIPGLFDDDDEKLLSAPRSGGLVVVYSPWQQFVSLFNIGLLCF